MNAMTDVTTEPRQDRPNAPLLTVEGVDFWYGEKQALFDIDLEIYPREVLALMGPSGCGKSTLLKLLNRMHEHIPGTRMTGRVSLEGHDIFDPEHDPVMIRRRYGWVAQVPNPFPKSVRENIAYGPRMHSIVEDGPGMDAHVRRCLERAQLWEELKNRLHEPGTALSGGQQQRLCIARALSINPEIMLMDEPCSSIDPVASAAIEGLILELKCYMPVVIITHNLSQAQRLADKVAFFHMGRLLEHGPAEMIFGRPAHEVTRSYVSGAHG